jgi:hypothetical protein
VWVVIEVCECVTAVEVGVCAGVVECGLWERLRRVSLGVWGVIEGVWLAKEGAVEREKQEE